MEAYFFWYEEEHVNLLMQTSTHDFFLKRRQKICLNLLIKKKRIAQLINENRAKTITTKPHENNT
jgi:hypothetical protein